MADLEERTFHREEEDGARSKYAELNGNDRAGRSLRDVATGTELQDEMDNELLHEIGAVSDARDKGHARNADAAKG